MVYEICKRCSKMFDKNGREYCAECFGENEKEYKILVEYINIKANHTILDIITETDLTLKTIKRFIENGSVSYVEEK